jgi:hypothetical protein
MSKQELREERKTKTAQDKADRIQKENRDLKGLVGHNHCDIRPYTRSKLMAVRAHPHSILVITRAVGGLAATCSSGPRNLMPCD